MEKSLGIIGGGNMGEALIAGITQSRLFPATRIILYEPLRERLEDLQKKFQVTAAPNNLEVVARTQTIILAVKPQTVPEVLREIGSSFRAHHLLISICAGVPLDYLQSFCPQPVRMIRAMPNTPALIRQGATALAPSPAAKPEDLSASEEIFQSLGITVIVKETQMDAVTGLSGSGPAYIFSVIEALAAGGVKEGLSQHVALALATQTALGAARLIQKTGQHPAALRDQVCTPGGTTMAGLYAMEAGGFRLALMDAVIAATKRSKELGDALKTAGQPSALKPGEKGKAKGDRKRSL